MFRSGYSCSLLEALSKNKVFANSWSFDISKCQWNARNFNHFAMTDRCHGVVMLEAHSKNKGLVNRWFLQYFETSIIPMNVQSFWSVGLSQIGLESSETKKCSQRFEIDHFCWRIFSALQSSKNWYESSRGSFRFTNSISDIPMTPSWSLRSFRHWRLVCCQLHVDTDFEIYGSTIGVCN